MPDPDETGRDRSSSTTFAVGVPAMTDYPPGSLHGPRVLRDFEFVWLIHGRATLTIGDRRLELASGSLYLLGPGDRHTFSWDAGQPSRHGYVHFGWATPTLASSAAWPLSRPFTSEDPLASLCRYLIWLGANRDDGWAARIHDVLDCLLSTFISGPLPTHRAPAWSPVDAVLGHAARIWADGTMRRLRVEEMAAAAAVSAGHLSRAFQASVGSSPVATIERIRLARAEQLLARSSSSLGAVAATTGFADQYHLSRRFRRCFGIPPATYRRLAATQDLPLPAEIVGVLGLVDRLSSM